MPHTPTHQSEEQRQAALANAPATSPTNRTAFGGFKTSEGTITTGTDPALTNAPITGQDLTPTPTPVVTPVEVPVVPTVPPPETTTEAPQPSSDDIFGELESAVEGVSGFNREAQVRQRTQSQQRRVIEINKQVALQQARAIEEDEAARVSGRTTVFGAVASSKARRTSAIESLKLSAERAAITGELSLATQLAGDAVDAKFSQREQELNTARANLIANFDSFSAADKKRAEALLLQIDGDLEAIEGQKDVEKAVEEQVNTASSFGATQAQMDDIRASDTEAEAIRKRTEAGLVEAAEELDTKVISAGGREFLINAQTGDIIKDLGASKTTGGAGGIGISPVTGKPFTDSQSKAATFAVRMEQSEDLLDVGKLFKDVAAFQFLKSNERRQFEQAEKNFMTALLRRESGAAIADSEFVSGRLVYIPQFNDDAITLEQKAEARRTALQGLVNESVGSFDQLKETLDAALPPPSDAPAPTSGTTKSGIKFTITP